MPGINVTTHTKTDEPNSIFIKLAESDFIFHLAGANRAESEDEFILSNFELTSKITNFLAENKIKSPIYFSSSIHAERKDGYGLSKYMAEKLLINLKEQNGNKVLIHRLNGIFGPGAKPFYNNIIATISHQIIRNREIKLFDKEKKIDISYVQDWLNLMILIIRNKNTEIDLIKYAITIKDLKDVILRIHGGKPVSNNFIDPQLLNKLTVTFNSYKSDFLEGY